EPTSGHPAIGNPHVWFPGEKGRVETCGPQPFTFRDVPSTHSEATLKHSFDESEQSMATWTIQALSLALCLSAGFQQGYIASVLNQPYVEIQKFINESWIYRTGHPMGSGSL
ncbi:hypothetical protein TELCIR_17295, partial [Teladorsagia circumcincta]